MQSSVVVDEPEFGVAEGPRHKALKRRVIRILKQAGARAIIVEATVKGMSGRVDVVGYWPSCVVAVECGNTTEGKIEALRMYCDVVVHIPYCWTPELFSNKEFADKIFNEVCRSR